MFYSIGCYRCAGSRAETKEDLEKALAEAKKANRVKSDFLSSMSHDIRTPMNAIVGMTTLALANLNDPEKIERLSKIYVFYSFCNLAFSDNYSRQITVKIPLFMDIYGWLLYSDVYHIFGRNHSRCPIVQIEAGKFENEGFYGDALRIKQILINLLSNALKFTVEGGKVLFRTEKLKTEKEDHVRYCFTVQDTGIGMTEEFMSHLFEPFIRSDRVTKVEGTGLGLSITKGLVDLMGGEIHVSSKLQKGTKFEIELEFEQIEPLKGESHEKTAEIEEEDLMGCHFLLVEDNEINSEILGELLQMRGATFTVKTDGLQAVNEFKQAKPGTYDAIFMDIQMPVMNGYEATREIRRSDHPEARSMIILAMTANAFAEDVQASIEAGMNGHIAKPVDMKLLYNTISSLLKKRNKRK